MFNSQKTTLNHASWIELSRSRLLKNLETLRTRSGHQDILAVIKANAYGHGLREIAKVLDGNVSYFGVATLREALELKENHPKTPVFLFGHLFSEELSAALLGGITLSVSSLEKAKEISSLSESYSRKTPVHIKIDTGMGRMGIPLKTAREEINEMRKFSGLLLDGIYTHFPSAEKKDKTLEKQLLAFQSLVIDLEEQGLIFRFRHAQNSAASVTANGAFLNMLRPGIALYGISPDKALTDKIHVSPVLSLKSRVLLTKRILKGESVGYGQAFVAKKDTNVAVVPFGYSQGYPWSAWQNASVIFKGKHYPLAGKVSMDYLSFELGDSEARVGDVVTLIGEEGNERVGADNWADWANTSPYEIVTRLNPHIPRVVVD